VQGALDWDSAEIAALIKAALEEDLGAGDITAAATVPAEAAAVARIVARSETVVAGLPLAERIFRALDPAAVLAPHFAEGQRAAAGAELCRITARARAILSGERTALNFLARLCGTAALTRRYVEAIAGTRAQIRDTRKTTPLLRRLEKYAVRCGGGANHRFGLYDAVLIKENHVALAGGIARALERARAQVAAPTAASAGSEPAMTAYESFRPAAPVEIQIEVRNEAELREALAAGAESVLLDNVFPTEAARLIRLVRAERPACVVEISGGVKLANVRAYAEAGADFISVGALTHSAPAADLSLLINPR
jgi:nicotinate-nucleotide pyrophosphorylase (carboxylating)